MKKIYNTPVVSLNAVYTQCTILAVSALNGPGNIDMKGITKGTITAD